MERKIYSDLLKWKRDSSKKPFLLYGNRQVGKTYTVLEFGKCEYKSVSYFNSDNNEELLNILKKEKIINKLIMHLGILNGETIYKNDTLIVIDNVSNNDIIKSIKAFKDNTDYHFILITSNKTLFNQCKSEDFKMLTMYQLDFFEYLINNDKKQLIDFIKESYLTFKPMPFHTIAMEEYENYLLIGGFPEVVNAALNNLGDDLLKSIQDKILTIYKSELLKNETLIDICRGLEIFDSIPYQLLKTNKKFQYGLIKQGSRSKEYEKAIDYLTNNNTIYKVNKVSNVKSPISSCKDEGNFKLFLNDTGLLFNSMNLAKNTIYTDNSIRNTIIEANIAHNLIVSGYNLYYYQSEGKAEVSFVIQTRNGKIIPIELVNKDLSKSKSLGVFLSKFKIEESIRITENNFSKKKGMKYIPVYALTCLKDSL
ncbi:MAG: DUF4143 domain-containing protein [Bacilli bacterium]